nr:NAD(+)--rifampin ADP-ribosyltransferase [Filimonas lacunae]
MKLCMQGMFMEASSKPEEAGLLFLQAWKEAASDFEKFIAAYYVARTQKNTRDKIEWLETAIQLAHTLNDDSVRAAFPLLYSQLAESYKEAGDQENAQKNAELAAASVYTPADKGPFYHGTKADLQTGDFLVAGKESNYQAELMMNHIYFTALLNGAGLAATLAKGDGIERVYIVEPTGEFEDDPNVTNKKFPGNPTRSYRTVSPLKIVGEITDWIKTPPEEVAKWRERLAANKGEIIN